MISRLPSDDEVGTVTVDLGKYFVFEKKIRTSDSMLDLCTLRLGYCLSLRVPA
jgi:hypothetical protein